MFEFYKKGQGKWTRGLTMGGAALIVGLGADWLYYGPLGTLARAFNLNSGGQMALQLIGSMLFVLGGLYLGFWVSYLRPGTGDFFIATEGEMKKVSWSSRSEIIGSTKVVIVTLIAMGALLFVVDLVFMVLFSALGVLQITGIKELFGMSGGTEPMAKQWYVLRVASNKEDRVRESLERKVKIEGLGEVIGKILVPTERISRIKGGVKRVAERKLYPGYVFIEMEMEENGSIPEQAWFLIKETSGVGDFIGADGKPVAMKPNDVDKMLAEAEKGSGDQATFKIEFAPGEQVKLKEGPFEGFEGSVDQVLADKGLIRVMVTIFGRATPVEVEYWQVEKV